MSSVAAFLHLTLDGIGNLQHDFGLADVRETNADFFSRHIFRKRLPVMTPTEMLCRYRKMSIKVMGFV